MDNLFAVIAAHKDYSSANIVIDRLLAQISSNKSTFNASEFSSENSFVYLVKYCAKNLRENKTTASLDKKEDISRLTTSIIANCRIDNQAELQALHSTSAVSSIEALAFDEQLILSSYKALGTDCFAMLKGNFQSIIWDENAQQLVAAIDPFSGRSLFYTQVGDVLYIASDAKVLAHIVKPNLALNTVALSQWLAGRPNPDLSMFNNITRLPAGHFLRYSSGQAVAVSKFWDIKPELAISYPTTDDYKAHFFELLTASVGNRLSVGTSENSPVFCQMSGGMDSTSVTAIAKQLLDKAQLPLHTLSHRYKNTKTCDESSNINDMIAKLSLQHQHYIELDQYEFSSFAQLYPSDFDNPGVVLSPKYHQELRLLSIHDAGVLLTGNGGDETCWGHSLSYRSRLYKGDLGVVSEVIAACDQLKEPVARSLYRLFMPDSMQNLLKLARQKPLHTDECPPWLTKRAADIVKENKKLFTNPYSATFDPAKHARYHGLKNTSTYNSMRSYQKVASGYGVDVRHPFFDVDIVEFSFAIPEKMLIQGVYPKWLLRQTMQEHLPKSVCWDKHKVVFDRHFANLVRNNKHELRELLSHGGLQDLGLLDNGVLLREFDAVVENPDGYLNVDMLYAILTQLWFQSHCCS
tara:strand:+ start:33865 stop:35769 length:1905 start_codon:yes stop_codon:yes gene_type:complete